MFEGTQVSNRSELSDVRWFSIDRGFLVRTDVWHVFVVEFSGGDFFLGVFF